MKSALKMNFNKMTVFGLSKKMGLLSGPCMANPWHFWNHKEATLCFFGVKSEFNTVTSNVQEGKYFSFSFFINSVWKTETSEPDNALDFFQLKHLFLRSCFC